MDISSFIGDLDTEGARELLKADWEWWNYLRIEKKSEFFPEDSFEPKNSWKKQLNVHSL